MEIIIKEDPSDVINGLIPFQIRAIISQTIVDAYKWIDLILNNTLAFKSKRSKHIFIPEAKNLAVEFFMIQATKSGKLPFEYRYAFNSNLTHSYLELYNDNILIHLNQVNSKNKCAKKAYCRDRHIKPVDSYINIGPDSEAFLSEKEQELYFQVNHGYQSSSPNFITLGIPNKLGKFSTAIQLLDEFAVIEGHYPKSKIEIVSELSFREFEEFVENQTSEETQGARSNGSK
ncbi:hypothetical protein D3C75_640340 [compost metagenome]